MTCQIISNHRGKLMGVAAMTLTGLILSYGLNSGLIRSTLPAMPL